MSFTDACEQFGRSPQEEAVDCRTQGSPLIPHVREISLDRGGSQS